MSELRASHPSLTPSPLARSAGGRIDGRYDDGDLTGKGVRVCV